MADNTRQTWNVGVRGRPRGRRSSRRAASSAAASTTAATKQSEPTRDQIAKRAYEIWLARGCEHGHDLDHWIEAERQLRKRSALG